MPIISHVIQSLIKFSDLDGVSYVLFLLNKLETPGEIKMSDSQKSQSIG